MTAITMEAALHAARMTPATAPVVVNENLKALLKAAAAADKTAPTPVQSKVTMYVRGSHFDSAYAAAMVVDALSDREVDVQLAMHAPNELPDGDNIVYIGFTDFSQELLAKMRDCDKRITILTYQGTVKVPKAKRAWLAKEAPKANSALSVVGIHQYYQGDQLINFGKLESLVSTTLTDIAFTWLARNKMEVKNPTLLKYRIAAARYISGAFPVVLDNTVDYMEVLPRERHDEQRQCKAALLELEAALHHSLRSRNVRDGLDALNIQADSRTYLHLWSDVVNTLQVCATDTYVRIPNRSPVRVGTPSKNKVASSMMRTVKLLIAQCTEGQWLMMADAMNHKSDSYATYQDVGNCREWRIVTPDLSMSIAVAHRLGEFVWVDGNCVRAYGKKN